MSSIFFRSQCISAHFLYLDPTLKFPRRFIFDWGDNAKNPLRRYESFVKNLHFILSAFLAHGQVPVRQRGPGTMFEPWIGRRPFLGNTRLSNFRVTSFKILNA